MADNILFPYDHLAQAVIFYHTRCPYMSINMRTPKEASTHTGEIKKGWASDRDNAIKHLQPKNFISDEYLSLRTRVSYIKIPGKLLQNKDEWVVYGN